MDKKLRKRLLTIVIAGLVVSGSIFLMLSIFSEAKDNNCLFAALFSIVLAGLFYIIKNFDDKKEDKK